MNPTSKQLSNTFTSRAPANDWTELWWFIWGYFLFSWAAQESRRRRRRREDWWRQRQERQRTNFLGWIWIQDAEICRHTFVFVWKYLNTDVLSCQLTEISLWSVHAKIHCDFSDVFVQVLAHFCYYLEDLTSCFHPDINLLLSILHTYVKSMLFGVII